MQMAVVQTGTGSWCGVDRWYTDSCVAPGCVLPCTPGRADAPCIVAVYGCESYLAVLHCDYATAARSRYGY